MKMKNILIILLVITLGCKDEFLLETINYVPIMVVEGMISNEADPYIIKLSLSSPVMGAEKIPFQGCKVTIYENSENLEVLHETEPGTYVTSEEGIQGVVGSKYSISIITPENKEYRSEPQKMGEMVEIDSVYQELIYLDYENYIYGFPGYQFYIDTKMAPDADYYFLWNMIETYEYTANYQVISVINVDGSLADYQKFYRCWKSDNVKYIFTGKTSNLSIPKISHQPLHFVGTDTKKLQERYSLLVKQYSIGKQAYDFWKSTEDQLSQENFLFAYQPYNIIGNIKNIENPDEIVFGNFTVASVTQKRIFVDRPHVAFYYENDCSLNFNIEDLNNRTTPAFIVNTEAGPAGVSEWCVNCTYQGGEAYKPDFWIDK